MEKHNTTQSCFWPSILKTFEMDLKHWNQATGCQGQLVFILLSLFLFSNVIHTCARICPPSFACSPLNLNSGYEGFGPVTLSCALERYGRYGPMSNHVVIRDQAKVFWIDGAKLQKGEILWRMCMSILQRSEQSHVCKTTFKSIACKFNFFLKSVFDGALKILDNFNFIS